MPYHISNYDKRKLKLTPFHVRHIPIVEFWTRVNIGGINECWNWPGSRASKSGYGHTRWYGKNTYTHRIAYEHVKGPIPEGLEICHTCNNPLCVNPNHLYAGTHQQNINDREERYRREQNRHTSPYMRRGGRKYKLIHGTRIMYQHGCRCQECRDVENSYRRMLYQRHKMEHLS